jgi:hypothetical protein
MQPRTIKAIKASYFTVVKLPVVGKADSIVIDFVVIMV